MAADLNPIKRQKIKDRGLRVCRGCAACFFCFLSSVFCSLNAAQALTDPTKPPTEISAPLTRAVAQEGDRLQSIIISPTRRAAIINGQTVELGAKYGEAKLVEVSESGVALQGPQGQQALTLFTGVEIKRKELPKENGMKHAAQKKKRVKKPANQIGKKEGK